MTSSTNIIIPFRLVSFIVVFGMAAAVGLPALGQAPAISQCPSIASQFVELAKQYYAAGECPIKPSKPLMPMRADGTDPNIQGCTFNEKNMKAWMNAHGTQYNTLQKQYGQCILAACPSADPIRLCVRSAELGQPCNPDLLDSDGDGIPDEQEALLINRFAPYVRYTKGEENRPIDPLSFIQDSDLVVYGNFTDSQDTVLVPNSVLAKTPTAVQSYAWGTSIMDSFNPSADYKSCVMTSTYKAVNIAIRPSKDGWEGGAPWSDSSNAHLVGMFAHVSPFVPNSASDLAGEHWGPGPNGPLSVATAGNCALRLPDCTNVANPAACAVIPPSHYISVCKHCIKIEYYQLFGLNNTHEAGIANHEGDLSIVTVVYDSDQNAAVGISNWVHGIEIRYDLTDPGSSCQIAGGQKICKGTNSGYQNLNLISLGEVGGGKIGAIKNLSAIAQAQNNLVFFNPDPSKADSTIPKDFEHPNVYVELGSHEFWPTQNWGVTGAPAHWGDDTEHSFLPQNIPNLGELEYPAGDVGKVMVNYLGYFGATEGNNDSSPGASLHTTWNWYVPHRTPISCSAAEN
jgi:hypothetical protein